jgi:hypothetical protein
VTAVLLGLWAGATVWLVVMCCVQHMLVRAQADLLAAYQERYEWERSK